MTPLDRLFRLDGTVALVTGASGGLGLHFARVLHAAGARVALAARRAGRLAAEAAALGPHACALPLDVTDAEAIAPAFDAAEAALGGPVTLLVNNAGVGRTRLLRDTTPEDWDATLDVNLRAPFLTRRKAAARMAPAGGGAIVNIASIAAERVSPRIASYAVMTDMNRDALDADSGRAVIARIPQRRLETPDDLTGAPLLLASPAGAHMTGATIVADGGHSIDAL